MFAAIGVGPNAFENARAFNFPMRMAINNAARCAICAAFATDFPRCRDISNSAARFHASRLINAAQRSREGRCAAAGEFAMDFPLNFRSRFSSGGPSTGGRRASATR